LSRPNIEVVKEIIGKLHEGADPDAIKREYSPFLEHTSSEDISRAEEELIRDGMPREQIMKLCDVHLAAFKESIQSEHALAPLGHPIRILMEEHAILQSTAEELWQIISALTEVDVEQRLARIRHLVQHFKDSEKHYLREENVLFPYLEKHGVTQPPAIMWMEHDQIRELEKKLFGLISEETATTLDNLSILKDLVRGMNELLAGHFRKENGILFPTALRVISQSEWLTIRAQFDEVGYCCFTPTIPVQEPEEEPADSSLPMQSDLIQFETGSLSKEVLGALFNTLPVDITFVDKDDRVRFFSESGGRIFVRSKAVIGREVQLCHPQKSMHKVIQILDDFRSNRRDSAEFWINLNGRTIYIRYFAVRNARN
jgi:DUF438 domain-containing protein